MSVATSIIKSNQIVFKEIVKRITLVGCNKIMLQWATNNNDYNYILLTLKMLDLLSTSFCTNCVKCIIICYSSINEHKLSNSVAKIIPLENTNHSCKTIVITISYSTCTCDE